MKKENEKKYYNTRGRAGEQQVYTSPALLLKKAYDYFEWCQSNPFTRQELVKSGDKKGDVVDIPLGRPFTEVGLCVFCGISLENLAEYEAKKEFGNVVSHIRNIINQEQIEGAVLGQYNASLVSRLQCLSDKTENPALASKPLIIHVSLQQTKEELRKLEEKLGENPLVI